MLNRKAVLVLSAHNLWEKRGWGEGDVMYLFLIEAGLDPDAFNIGDCLYRVVMNVLAPKLPGVRIRRSYGCHNPVAAKTPYDDDLADVKVGITLDEFMEALALERD